MFVTTGYCCFVGPKLAITISEVVNYAFEIGAARGGSPVIRTERGLAPFAVKNKLDIGNLVAVEMGEIDDRHIVETLKEHEKEEFGKSSLISSLSRCKLLCRLG